MEKILKYVVFILILSFSNLIGQVNFPKIKNFTDKDYNAYPQNWDAIEGSNGFIYVGNIDGLLEYNGSSWKLHSYENQQMIRDLIMVNDTMYFSGYNQFGYYVLNEKGVESRNVLSDSLDMNLGNVWSIHPLGNDIYFASSKVFLKYNVNTKSMNELPKISGYHSSLRVWNGVLWTSDTQLNLYSLENEKLEEVYNELTDSINYAKMIQFAVLPEKSSLNKYFKNNALFFRPRDIISGDFYWINEVKGKTVLIVSDCTGHGVPGAFMSMLGTTLLNEIVLENGTIEPSKILQQLNQRVIQMLNKKGGATSADGMDLSVIVIDNENSKVRYGAAQQKIYLIRNKELTILESVKMPIGGRSTKDYDYPCFEMEFQSGDKLVLSSDGYQDQFGGPKNKKIGSKRLKEIILNNSDDLTVLENQLPEFFDSWKGKEFQLDDIVVITVEL